MGSKSDMKTGQLESSLSEKAKLVSKIASTLLGEVAHVPITHLCANLLQRHFCSTWLEYNEFLSFSPQEKRQFLHKFKFPKGEGSEYYKRIMTTTMVSSFHAARLLIEKPFAPLDTSTFSSHSCEPIKSLEGEHSYKYGLTVMRELADNFAIGLANSSNLVRSMNAIRGFSEVEILPEFIGSLRTFSNFLENDPNKILVVDEVDQDFYNSSYILGHSGVCMVRMGYIFPMIVYYRNVGQSKRHIPFVFNAGEQPFCGMPYHQFPARIFNHDTDIKITGKIPFTRPKQQKN